MEGQAMSREEIEKKIAEHLAEIRELVRGQVTENCGLCMAISTTGYWAFELAKDENGEPTDEKIFDIFYDETL
jgi:hypothetical protein